MSTVLISTGAGTGGTVTPVSGNQTVGVPIILTAIPTVGYDFIQWSWSVGTSTEAIHSITPSIADTYVASFALHDLTSDDYSAITAFFNLYFGYAGTIGNTPNAAMANKMRDNVISMQVNIMMFNIHKSSSQDTSGDYQNIVEILNSFNPSFIPIV